MRRIIQSVMITGLLVFAGCASSDKPSLSRPAQASNALQPQVLIAKIRGMEEAHNRHDLEKELGYYSDDARFEVVGAWAKEGKAEFRKLLELDVLMNSRLEFTDFRIEGNTVTCKVREQNDMIALLGMDAMMYEYAEHHFRGGLIQEVRTKLSDESLQAEERQFGLFEKWAAVNRPKELEEWKTSDPGDISKEKVTQWISLLMEWRKATDNPGGAKP